VAYGSCKPGTAETGVMLLRAPYYTQRRVIRSHQVSSKVGLSLDGLMPTFDEWRPPVEHVRDTAGAV